MNLRKRDIIILAVPLMFSQLLSIAMGVVDTIMAGAVDVVNLSAVSLGSSVFFSISITCLGLITGVSPLLSREFGRGNIEKQKRIFLNSIVFSFFGGILIHLMLFHFSSLFLHFFEMPINSRAIAEKYIKYISLSSPFIFINRACLSYCLSLGKTRIAIYSGILSFLLNIFLNYILIFGFGNFIGLGAVGAAIATAIANTVGSLYVLKYSLSLLQIVSVKQVIGRLIEGSLDLMSDVREILAEGYPIAISYFLEISAFSLVTLLVARFGDIAVAANQIMFTLTNLVYVVPSALATVALSKISEISVKNERKFTISAIFNFQKVGAFYSLLVMCIFMLKSDLIISIYTDDKSVLLTAKSIIIVPILYQLFDVSQVLSASILRGLGYSKITTFIQFVGFWIIGLGGGSFLGLYLNKGLFGYWSSLGCGLVFIALALIIFIVRFNGRKYEIIK